MPSFQHGTLTVVCPRFTVRRLALGLLLALGLIGLGGCGNGSPYNLVPITAKVTYEDGSPIPGEIVQVTFYPQVKPLDAKTYPRAASAQADPSDGSVKNITTITTGDGVPMGKQKVTVASVNGLQQPTGAVPPEYADAEKTPLVVEVTKRGQHFDLQVPKPRQK